MIRAVSGPDIPETEGNGPAETDRNPDEGTEEGIAAQQMNGGEVSEAPPPSDDDAPIGPSESEEAAFLAEQGASESAGSRRSSHGATEDEEEAKESLPPLEDLVNRIPAETRALMDELFRARFVTVKRVPKSALK